MANLGIVKKLFLVRHGEAEPNISNVKILTDKGKPQLQKTSEDIIKFGFRNTDCLMYSSIHRRAVESAIYLTDCLGGDFGKYIVADPGLENSYDRLCKILSDERCPFTQLIIVSHLEFLNNMPARLRRSRFNLTDTPEDFGQNPGKGVFIDLTNGEYSRLG